MKKFISFMLVVILLMSMATVAFAVTTKSPSVEAIFTPQVLASYFKVCDSEGKLVRYLSRDEISFDGVKDFSKYSAIPNLLYAFTFSSAYELKEGEYIEFPIYFNAAIELELKAIVEETQNELEVIPIVEDYWMINITEYGTILVTVIEVDA